jgi:hypothetical protein
MLFQDSKVNNNLTLPVYQAIVQLLKEFLIVEDDVSRERGERGLWIQTPKLQERIMTGQTIRWDTSHIRETVEESRANPSTNNQEYSQLVPKASSSGLGLPGFL